MNEIVRDGEELRKMYEEAYEEAEYEKVIQRRKEIERRISEADIHEEPDLFGDILLPGYWAEYYYWLKGFIQQNKKINEKEVRDFLKRMAWFWRACRDDEIAASYGDLLSTGYDYLLADSKNALKVLKELQERAERAGNRNLRLRVINRILNHHMYWKNWQEAVKEGEKVEQLLPVEHEKELRHFGNIINNRGAAKIRGDIDYPGGITDLMRAAYEFYLKEEPIPWKHVLGIIGRLQEAKEKLTQR